MLCALVWCKHVYINQIVKFASHRFQGIAGRSNIERPTFDVQFVQRQALISQNNLSLCSEPPGRIPIDFHALLITSKT